MAILINASARSLGDTGLYAQYLHAQGLIKVQDLCSLKIAQYDYQFQNQQDDFLPFISQIIKEHKTWVFATPVYWYTMSGHLKTFLDRISDLLDLHKELGRQIRGKKLGVLAVSSKAEDLPIHFYEPLKSTAHYLGMDYLGDCHAFGDSKNISEYTKNKLIEFHKLIQKS